MRIAIIQRARTVDIDLNLRSVRARSGLCAVDFESSAFCLLMAFISALTLKQQESCVSVVAMG